MRKSYLDTDTESEEEEESGRHFKIIVIGPRGVGKSSLIHRLRTNEFSIQYTPTRLIEIYTDVKLGDISADIWDVPPNVCKFYNLTTLKSDVVLVMFDSDKKESLEKAVSLYHRVRDKLYHKEAPDLWFVYRGEQRPTTMDCHPDRLFHIDNMSRDGLLDLIYDIRCKLLRKYI